MKPQTQPKMNEKQRKAVAIGSLAEMLGRQMTDGALDMYVSALEAMPAKMVEETALMAARTNQDGFLPPPSKLYELAGLPTAEDAAVRAWGVVLGAVERSGPYRHVDFGDRTVNGAIRTMGGWPEFIAATFQSPESEKWGRLEFMKIYRSLVKSPPCGELFDPLPGINYAQIINGEIATPVPVRIDCPPSQATLIAAMRQQNQALPPQSQERITDDR